MSQAQAASSRNREIEKAVELTAALAANIEKVVHGKPEEIKRVLAALISGGHVLIEDLPGTAKTVLARSLAVSVEGATFTRIQCTPDLQPTDVTGLSIFDQRTREFEFRPGPVFTNILLVDEINRAMPKTQSALLEAMAEKQVTVEGLTHTLEEPFLVLATQNPIEQEGTFPLPEAQLDRFAIRIALGYPQVEIEMQIVEEQRHAHPLASLGSVLTPEQLLELRAATEHVYVDRIVLRWLVELVRATREVPLVAVGASVRASLALERVARAYALVNGRSYVDPADIEQLFVPIVAHRLVFEPFVVTDEGMADHASLLERVKAACLELAPIPEPTWSEEASGTKLTARVELESK